MESRSTSAPPRPSDNAKEIRKACYEFKKSGTCKKAADCAYEHVAAAPENGRKKRQASPPRLGAYGAPDIFLFEDAEECYIAASEDISKRVSFAKLKIIVGPRKQYEKDVKRPRIEPAPRDPRIGRIHVCIVWLRA